ncbi:hypothetical protein [Paenibacillus kyungheensis]
MYAYPSSKTDHTSKKLPHPKAHLYTSNTSTPIQLQAVTQQMLTQDLADPMSTYPSNLPNLQKQIGNQAIAQMLLKSTAPIVQPLQSVPLQCKLNIDDKKATPAHLLQVFEQVGVKDKILLARQQHKVNIQLFTAILQQEIDEHDQIISFIKNEDVAKQQIYQIASNVLQKLALNAVMDRAEGETDIFYDSVEQHVMKADVMPRLDMFKEQLAIFPADIRTKWLSYYQIVSLSQAQQPIVIEAEAVDSTLNEMEKYLKQYIDQTKKQLDTVTQRVNDDPMLAVVASQLSDYLNGFVYLGKEHLIHYSLKQLTDNLLFITRRLDSLYADMKDMNTEPVVYFYPTANTIDHKYISMVHNNWNAGRGNPKTATSAKHIHVNGYSENVIYTMQNSNKHLYIHGYVNWHLDKSMSGSQIMQTQTIENYSQNLNLFSIYMKYEEEWISQQAWYVKAVAKYLAVAFPI